MTRVDRLGIVLATLAVVGTLAARAQIQEARREVRTLFNLIGQETFMQSKEAEWKDADGVTWRVITPRGPEESMKSWCARHDAAVTAEQINHPPA